MTKAEVTVEHRLELKALHQQSTPAGVRNATPSALVFVTPAKCALLMQSLKLKPMCICQTSSEEMRCCSSQRKSASEHLRCHSTLRKTASQE